MCVYSIFSDLTHLGKHRLRPELLVRSGRVFQRGGGGGCGGGGEEEEEGPALGRGHNGVEHVRVRSGGRVGLEI